MEKKSIYSFLVEKILRSQKSKIAIDSIDIGIPVNNINILEKIPTKPAIKIEANGITNFIRKSKQPKGCGKMQDYLCIGINSKNLKENYFDGINNKNFSNAINNSMAMIMGKKSPIEYIFRHEGLIETFSNLDSFEPPDDIRVNSIDIKYDFETRDDDWFPKIEDIKLNLRNAYESYEDGCKINNRKGSYSNNKANKDSINFYNKLRELVESHNSQYFYNYFLTDQNISKNLKRIELTLIETSAYERFGLLNLKEKNNLNTILNNVENYGTEILIKALNYYLIHGGEDIIYNELSKVEKNVYAYLNRIVKDGEIIEDEKGFNKFYDNFLIAKNPNRNIISDYKKALRKIYHLFFTDVHFDKNRK